MAAPETVIALDCGTQSVRALLIDPDTGRQRVAASEGLTLKTPGPHRVEIDPDAVLGACTRVLRKAAAQAPDALCIGVTNMRETAFAWSRKDGRPVHDGIMWMSQQSQGIVDRWDADGTAELIHKVSGLRNHSFFFGSKVAWLFDTEPRLKALAATGELAVGTLDSWLLYSLTGGSVHATDVSNASRYQLLNLSSLEWDPALSEALGIPAAALPALRSTSAHFGLTDPAAAGARIPITAMAGDQQASLMGHGCRDRGAAKATFGTSGVVNVNIGDEPVWDGGLVTSVAWSSPGQRAVYEMEGSSFHCGYTLSWLTRMHALPSLPDVVDRSPLEAEDRVYLVPSFTELGAPRWPKGSGAIIGGLRMDTTPADVVRAGIESMAFGAFDLLDAVPPSAGRRGVLSVDGGGANSDYLCQLMADLTGSDVVRPQNRELTALGIARMAARTIGRDIHAQDEEGRRFSPSPQRSYALEGFSRWKDLIGRNL
ncbi:FGGY family carbohydrate kinase [Sinomonas sp.]|uniref:FGGY family carbohydrate kinase n=1 Tax=Sinomonas sp. TaxID=1914986 RepID=UPI002FE21ADA